MKSHLQSSSPLILVLVLWLAGLGAAMQFAKMSVAFHFIRDQYPNAGTEIGLLVSAIGFLGIGLGLFAGLIVAKTGFRKLLLGALLLGALMSIYQATLPSFTMMLVSRLVEGVSHLIIVVAAPTLIAQLSNDKYRGMAMTLWSTFFGVAFALIAWFGIPLVTTYGLASLFIAHAILLLAVATVLMLILPSNIIIENQDNKLNFSHITRQHVQTYKSPRVAAPAIGWLFYTLTFVSLLTVLPDLVPANNRVFVAGAMPVASIAASIICGVFILPRLSPINTIILGFLLAAGIIQLLWLNIDKSWICIALMGVLGLVQSASFAAIPNLNPDAKSQAHANGAMAQMGNLGNTLGTPILLGLLGIFGIKGMIWGVLFCYFAAIGTHIWMKHRRETQLAG